MSKYSVNPTVLREEKYLVEALKELGYEVEVHTDGAPLNSYYAEQEAKAANIIIRRQHLHGAYGDIGFIRQPDGQFAMGIFAPPQAHGDTRGPAYGRWKFDWAHVVKWNCVFRLQNPDGLSGDFTYHIFVTVGSLEDVRTALMALQKM